MKLKKGDQVKIISGNEKGKQGKILSVFDEEGRVIVEGLNMKKKHMRPRQQGKKGEVILKSASLAVSRAMLICKKCGKSTRIGFWVSDAGVKVRICKKCGAEN